ncbi:right-handed parallel beta-helix repeat-containing protein [Pseudomarimonas salicorniae]|uniref:Right-handed parallel beta-helix repeat-containing protein n=1 Tax=Pseudomarimonas salicorniae TaxID=2933270 RepID=A0ABT0GHQ0_9GAMM|nr:right-handed parallel beta-helix repeat-containing protein [Lysobacter sp. CAU 1642]MCK7593714.1 right-handed parallel beta-helix repeat-containing protein [Lysobacter sp. CAU 1642]
MRSSQSACAQAVFIVVLALCALHPSCGHAQVSYYVDPVNGDDAQSGSLAAPWRSFRNIISYYHPSFRPPQWVRVQPGDTLFLMEGVHDTILHPGGDGGAADGGAYLIYFRGEQGSPDRPIRISAFANARPILDPGGAGHGVHIQQGSHFDISGISVRNAYSPGEGGGITLADVSGVRVHGVEVHSTDGVDNNNVSGLHCNGCRDIEIFGSRFYDNYDRTNADTGGQSTPNSSNMVFFRGENVSVHDNEFFNSVPITASRSGMCLKYKHASGNPAGYFRVYNNVFRNCKHAALQTGTANTHFHDNVVIDSGPVQSMDLGGPTHQTNQLFEFNTIYRSGGIQVDPTVDWRDADFPDDPSNIVIRHNIVYDTAPAYHQENGLINIGTYMSDALYAEIEPELTLEANCYFNPGRAVQLNIGAANGGGFGILGGQYTLAEWQQGLGFDLDSREADPLFADADTGDFRPAPSGPCAGMGVFARDTGRIFADGFELPG